MGILLWLPVMGLVVLRLRRDVNRLPITYELLLRCSCGKREIVRSDKPDHNFQFYSLVARVDMANHRAFGCPLNTFTMGVKHEANE